MCSRCSASLANRTSALAPGHTSNHPPARPPAHLHSNRLNWPGGAESKKSVKAVAKLRRLRDYVRLHGDESLRPHLDELVDLVCPFPSSPSL